MSTIGISDALGDLFRTPLRAVVEAEADYRRIWASWLEAKRAMLVKPGTDELKDGVDMAAVLAVAPVVDLNGKYDIAITKRIAEVKESQGGVSGGLSVGPIHASGTYGFANQRSQESTFQAATSITISNAKMDLSEYLAQHRINVTDPASLDAAVKLLKSNEGVPVV